MLIVLPPFLSVIKLCDILDTWTTERWNWTKNENARNKSANKTLHVKLESGCNGKNEDVPKEVTLAKTFTLKKLLGKFYKFKYKG